jgi:hypothetical protein
MPFILTRIQVGDYDVGGMFDQDRPGARSDSKGWSVFRNVDDPSASRTKSGPYVVEVAETVER